VERFGRLAGIALDRSRFAGRFGRGRFDGLDVGLLLPETFMNRSGTALAEALRMLPVADPAEDLLVVFDDLDLPFGRLRLRRAGGAGGHRGVEDVTRCLGGGGFPRLRFGIGRPPPEMDALRYVLEPFSAEERARLPAAVDAAAQAVATVLREGVDVAMNRVNPVGSPVDPQEDGPPA